MLFALLESMRGARVRLLDVRLLVLPLFLLGLTGCHAYPPSAPVPARLSDDWVMRARERWPDATESELHLGQQLFVDRCQDCHEHPDVTFLPEDEWPSTLRRMSRYAKLDETEGRAVLRFVLTARGRIFGHPAAFDETERPIELRPALPGPPAPETEGIDLPSGPPPAPAPG